MNEQELRDTIRLTIEELYPVMYIEDIAAFLNISVDSVQRLLKKNRLPAPRKIGKRRVWLRSEVNKFMEGEFDYD